MLLFDQTIDASKVIQLMLSPAVMISACGLLLLGANTKYSNVLNRIRLLNDEKRRLVIKTADHGTTPEENVRIESTSRQMHRLNARAKLVRNSVISYTIAAGFFVISSLLIGLALFVGFVEINYISTSAFLVGMVMVFIGIIFGVLESRKGYEIVQLEIKAEE
jgi:VIT1/CCC1 family predicted Fe2+/Mn2+ transporter